MHLQRVLEIVPAAFHCLYPSCFTHVWYLSGRWNAEFYFRVCGTPSSWFLEVGDCEHLNVKYYHLKMIFQVWKTLRTCCGLQSIDALSLWFLSFSRWLTRNSLDIFQARKLGLTTKRTNLYQNKESAKALSFLTFIHSNSETRFLPLLFRGWWIPVETCKSCWIAWVLGVAVIILIMKFVALYGKMQRKN